jgi:hypothetical protein
MYSCNLSYAFGMVPSEFAGNWRFFPVGHCLAHREELGEEHKSRAFAPCINNFLVLVELLFCLSHKGKEKQTELDSLGCDVLNDDDVAQFKELL